MRNHICVAVFLFSSFWKTVLSGNIEGSFAVDDKNFEPKENNVQNVRGGDEIDIGGIPMSEIYSGKMWNQRIYNYDDKNNEKVIFERNGYKFEFDGGNPDVHSQILRPCQAYDTFCIRKFFAEHSKCSISGRPVPEPLHRAFGNVAFPFRNLSETQVTADYGGANNARISEFYINKATDNLVIAVTFDSASKYSKNTYFKYYLRGREPIVTEDFGGIQYGVLTVTVIIPNTTNLELNRSEIYTYGDNSNFAFALGPRIYTSTDPEVPAMYATFLTDIPTEYLEEISHQGYFLIGNYIQYNICDFGIKIL